MHRDFNDAKKADWGVEENAAFPLSIIVAFEENTRIRVYEENPFQGCKASLTKAEVQRCKFVQIPVGHAIVFHGLLIHSGCSYEDENIRAHSYALMNGIKLPTDEVTVVERTYTKKI